jgi:hypothetical protein
MLGCKRIHTRKLKKQQEPVNRALTGSYVLKLLVFVTPEALVL